jgi:hypothetical protein
MAIASIPTIDTHAVIPHGYDTAGALTHAAHAHPLLCLHTEFDRHAVALAVGIVFGKSFFLRGGCTCFCEVQRLQHLLKAKVRVVSRRHLAVVVDKLFLRESAWLSRYTCRNELVQTSVVPHSVLCGHGFVNEQLSRSATEAGEAPLDSAKPLAVKATT